MRRQDQDQRELNSASPAERGWVLVLIGVFAVLSAIGGVTL